MTYFQPVFWTEGNFNLSFHFLFRIKRFFQKSHTDKNLENILDDV